MIYDLLELACNRALAHDPHARASVARLAGKTVVLQITGVAQKLIVLPMPHGLEFSAALPADVDVADVSLSASPGALMKIARHGIDDAELAPGELTISGDPIVGQRFARILGELDIDWVGLLAEHLGETPAVLVTGGLRRAREIAEEGSATAKEHVNRLLSEELELVAGADDVAPFLQQVDTLRGDVDRLQARLRRLQTQL